MEVCNPPRRVEPLTRSPGNRQSSFMHHLQYSLLLTTEREEEEKKIGLKNAHNQNKKMWCNSAPIKEALDALCAPLVSW